MNHPLFKLVPSQTRKGVILFSVWHELDRQG